MIVRSFMESSLAFSIRMKALSIVSDLFLYMASHLGGTTSWLRVQMNVHGMHSNLEGGLFSLIYHTPGWPTTFSWFSWLNFTFLSSRLPGESHFDPHHCWKCLLVLC